jgi:hypothetical protein
LVAYMMELDGDVYVPIYVKLEVELEKMNKLKGPWSAPRSVSKPTVTGWSSWD